MEEEAKGGNLPEQTPTEDNNLDTSLKSSGSSSNRRRFYNRKLMESKTSSVSRKRRRGKTKRKNSMGSNRKTVNWKTPMTRKDIMRNLVPYNTNKVLMEDHEVEIEQRNRRRDRDSSFSVDSDENYFYSLPEDEEEFLTKEFATVYETAKCERLSTLTKEQLIEEYLLLETNFDQLSKRYNLEVLKPKPKDSNSPGKERTEIEALQEQVLKLISENYDLKNQLDFFRRKSTILVNGGAGIGSTRTSRRCSPNNSSTSEDSESDSSSGSSTSSSSSESCSNCKSPKQQAEEIRVITNGSIAAVEENEDISMNVQINEEGEGGAEMEKVTEPVMEEDSSNPNQMRRQNHHQRHRTRCQRRNSKIHQQQTQATAPP